MKIWRPNRLTGSRPSVAPEPIHDHGTIIRFGDFRIDLRCRQATLRDHDLELTSEEFDVLVFLTRHHQSVATSHTLLTTNAGENQFRRTEFLKVLLSLRNKLDAAGDGIHYLRMEPWVIYRFDPMPPAAP
ncbi:MAG TPA: winged helix-turn-helix domain-containing protein [Candidatus Angelobacter sp.]|nr:winged helix-turn-helix domain-containing protein [Candidatus Angelobacter sp.]